jgi:hypothetical protein
MGLKFLKKGQEVQQSLEKADAQTEAKKEAAETRVSRFFLPKEKSTVLTFLDGFVDDEGLLQAVAWWEHQCKINGDWRNWFPCTAEMGEPCPICAEGASPSWVAAFTVIDHSEWTSKQSGKTYKNQRKLFVCKRDTFRTLQLIAKKRGGLAHCTFDVSRSGEKSENVGNLFDFTEKHKDLNEFLVSLGVPEEERVPYDYEDGKTIRPYSADELKKLGFGGSDPVTGSADTQAQLSGGGNDYAQQL